ncbi:MAG TPA: hypothetical protein VFD36_30270 [Kofleriaceae bacterium]|nr:hypothetical protein [Kofleriaceae bacterium]
MTRICITGGPRTGKTTLARSMGRIGLDIRCTDDLIAELAHLGNDAWSEASRLVGLWFDEPGPWIIEGVAVSRALRKWKDAHPGEPPPVDRVIYLAEPHEEITPKQIAMMKGVFTVHSRDVEPWLRSHGITTEYL